MEDNFNDVLDGTQPDEVDRDRWGRYLLPDPVTGNIFGWTRATTLVKALGETHNLEAWKQRNLVFGLGQRPDLFAQAASIASTEEKDALGAIASAAIEAAAGSASANMGTAIHRFTERIDRGESPNIPEQWAADVLAYADVMAEAGIGILVDHGQDMIERICVTPQVQVAGTADRILTGPWPKPRIGDLKTGKDLRYSMGEIAAQLAIYAHATHWWDAKAKTYHPMPEVDQEVAIVMHVPIGKGTCELIEVDIASGWRAVQLARALKAWRSRRDLSTTYQAAQAIEALASYEKPTAAPKTPVAAAEVGHVCEHCEKAYKSASGLKKHVETVHTPDELQAHAEQETAENDASAGKEVIADAPKSTPDVGRQVDTDTGEITDIDPAAAKKAEAELFDARFAWLKARVQRIIDEGHVQLLANVWSQNSADVKPFKKGGPTTHAEIDLLAGTCNLVESSNEVSMSFGDVDPAKQQPSQTRIKELLAS